MTPPPLKIAVIGTGYVGLVTGVCLAHLGFPVHCIDKNTSIIEGLEKRKVPFFEPGLQDLLSKNMEEGRLQVSTGIDVIQDSDLVFIAVGTPAAEDGQANLSHLHGAIEEIAPSLKQGAVVVIKSTVPMGTNRQIQATLEKLSGKRIHVVSNPEFLREGAALSDFMQPDRIILGTLHPEADLLMRRLYQSFVDQGVPLLSVSWETAELVKYASNSFLALKIGFINELSNLCDHAGADVMEVAQGMGLDHRIGRDFLNPGPGYGGSCFPKDTLALAHVAQTCGVPLTLLTTLIHSNERRKGDMAAKVIQACGGTLEGKTLGILGITFKAQTDDMRDSPSLVILPLLEQAGARLQIYDPQGMERGREIFTQAHWCESPYDAAQGANGLVVLTEWGEFRTLDLEALCQAMATPLLLDFRNLYELPMIPPALTYVSLGRSVKKASPPYDETDPLLCHARL